MPPTNLAARRTLADNRVIGLSVSRLFQSPCSGCEKLTNFYSPSSECCLPYSNPVLTLFTLQKKLNIPNNGVVAPAAEANARKGLLQTAVRLRFVFTGGTLGWRKSNRQVCPYKSLTHKKLSSQFFL